MVSMIYQFGNEHPFEHYRLSCNALLKNFNNIRSRVCITKLFSNTLFGYFFTLAFFDFTISVGTA